MAVLQPSLDVLGPVGRYAGDTLGPALRPLATGLLFAWALLPALPAYHLFSRRDAA